MSPKAIILSIVCMCAIVMAVSYFYVLQKQNEAKAILKALADVQLGVTKKVDFLEHMEKFDRYKSSTEFAGYSNDKSYQGVGYGISNIVLDRYSLFPYTVVSVSVYFDSNGIAHMWDVAIHNKTASANLMDELDPPPSVLIPRPAWAQRPKGMVLHQVNPQELKRVATSCFTSWFGCDTSAKLISGRN